MPLVDERPRLTLERLQNDGEFPSCLFIRICKYSKFRAENPDAPEQYLVQRSQFYDFDGLGVKFVYTLTLADPQGKQIQIATVHRGWEPSAIPFVPLRDIILDSVLFIR